MFSSKYYILFIIYQTILILNLYHNIESKPFPNLLSFKEAKISKKYSNLIKYIESNGGYVNPKLIPNEISNTNRYITTKETIKKDEILLFAPDPILISKLHKDVFRKCQEAYGYDEEHDYDCIVYFMTIDKYNSSSFFKPYYDYLPLLNKSDFIFSLSEKEIEMFKDIGITEGIHIYQYFLKKAKEPVEEKLKKFAEKNSVEYEKILEEFDDNFIMVGTRNFGRPDYIFDLSTMVPFLDLLNHSDKNNTHWFYDEKKNGYILIAIRDIEKGEEITDSYGKYYNSLLYRTYGFVIPGNSYHDIVNIKIDKESFSLDIDSIETKIGYMFEKLVKTKNFEFNEAKKYILYSLNDKKNYYLNLKTERYSINIIIKEHLSILNEYITYLEKYDYNLYKAKK